MVQRPVPLKNVEAGDALEFYPSREVGRFEIKSKWTLRIVACICQMGRISQANLLLCEVCVLNYFLTKFLSYVYRVPKTSEGIFNCLDVLIIIPIFFRRLVHVPVHVHIPVYSFWLKNNLVHIVQKISALVCWNLHMRASYMLFPTMTKMF